MSDNLRVSSILGVMAAIVFGWLAGLFFPQIMVYATFPATLFQHALLFLVAPLLFSAVVVGISTFGDFKKAGRSFGKLFWYYIGTGAIAAVLAAAIAMIVRPGEGASWFGHAGAARLAGSIGYTFWDILDGIIPMNLPGSVIDGHYVGLFLFSAAIGLFLIQLDRQGNTFSDIVSTFLGLQKRILGVIATILPYGLFFVIGSAVANNSGFLSSTIQTFSDFAIWLIAALALFGIVILPLVQWSITGESPIKYLINLKPAFATAFATGSTAAAFPMLYHSVAQETEDDRVTGTALPFGLLIGTHGSTILTVMLTLFVAQAIGIQLSMMQIGLVLVGSFLVPVGIVGFPAAQAVVLGAMFQALGFPAEAFALLGVVWGGEWLISRFVAPVNLMCSGVGAAVVTSMYDLKTARTAAPARRPAPSSHRYEDRRGGREHSRSSHDNRGERDRRPNRDEQPRERSFDSASRDNRESSGGRDRNRGDRNERFRGPRDGQQDRRRDGGGRGGDRDSRRSGGRYNRPDQEDRGRFRSERPHRERDAESRDSRQERTTDTRPPEPAQRETPVEETPQIIARTVPRQTEAAEAPEQTSAEVHYGRSARPKFERNSGESTSERSESNEASDNAKEADFPASGEVSYGRSRRRPDFPKSESSGSSNGNTTAEEEPIMTGEISFGRSRRRPGGK